MKYVFGLLGSNLSTQKKTHACTGRVCCICHILQDILMLHSHQTRFMRQGCLVLKLSQCACMIWGSAVQCRHQGDMVQIIFQISKKKKKRKNNRKKQEKKSLKLLFWKVLKNIFEKIYIRHRTFKRGDRREFDVQIASGLNAAIRCQFTTNLRASSQQI